MSESTINQAYLALHGEMTDLQAQEQTAAEALAQDPSNGKLMADLLGIQEQIRVKEAERSALDQATTKARAAASLALDAQRKADGLAARDKCIALCGLRAIGAQHIDDALRRLRASLLVYQTFSRLARAEHDKFLDAVPASVKAGRVGLGQDALTAECADIMPAVAQLLDETFEGFRVAGLMQWHGYTRTPGITVESAATRSTRHYVASTQSLVSGVSK